MEDTEVDAPACGDACQLVAFAVGEDRCGGISPGSTEVHVVREEHHAAVGACVIHPVVLAAGSGVVSRPAEDGVGHAAEPTVEIDDLLESSVEGGSRFTEVFIVGHDRRDIVGLAVVLVEEEPAIEFGVIAEVGDTRAGHAVGLRSLEAVAVLAGRVIDKFVFVELSVSAVVKLRIEEDVTVARHLQQASTGQP